MNFDVCWDSLFPQWETTPDAYRRSVPLNQREYLINGEIKQWQGPFQDVHSPIYIRNHEGQAEPFYLGSYPLLSVNEAMMALDSAVKAFNQGRGKWPTMPVEARLERLQTFIALMKEKRSEVVNLLMWEIGKNLKDAEKEFDRTVLYLLDTIEAVKELDRVSSHFTIEQGIIAQIRRAPLGVTLCMGPYNYPLNETFTTMIPALIMGNTVVFKPPKYGVLLHYPLLELFRDAFPAGVVNTVYGEGRVVIPPMIASGNIDVLAFIGSSPVADSIKKQHPKPHRLRSVLGLEAKNPAIILADADLGLAVDETVLGSLSFNGQRCTALKIVFAHEDIVQEFLDRFCAAVDTLTFGMPWDNPFLTPLPERGKCDYLRDLVVDAQNHGARILNRYGAKEQHSFFYPAVLFPVNSQMKIFHEEQFGPIVPIVPFRDLEEPIEYMLNSNYGQQVSIFGADSETIARLIDPMVNQVCRVNINSQCQRGPDTFPFTGRKDSAEGTLSVTDALRVFTIRTLVAAKSNELNKNLVKTIIRQRQSNFLSRDFIF